MATQAAQADLHPISAGRTQAGPIPAGNADELIARARAIAPLLMEEAPRNEAGGRLTDTAEKALRDNRLLGLYVPEAFGGSDLSPRDSLRVLETLFTIDASTAWVAMASNINSSISAYMAPDLAATMFGPDMPICAGQGAPIGKAEVVAGGYRLTGGWSYGSGMLNARYAMGGAMLRNNGELVRGPDGAPQSRLFMLPVDQIEPKGNWDVVGLRATGSVDYAITDVFVPESHAIDMHHAAPITGSNWQLAGLNGRVLLTHTSFAMGVGRRALDELKAFATKPGSRGCTADGEAFREHYAKAEARYRAARALVMDSWARAEESLARGETMSREQITLCRLALTHMTDVTVDVAQFAFRQGGGTSLRQGSYQRYFRDAMAGGQHIQAGHNYYALCGQDLLGMADDKDWTLFALVDAKAH